jgi:hypothetical protein
MQKKTRPMSRGQITAKLRGSSPFEKHRGIGNGKAGSGRKAVVRAIRELRRPTDG